MNNYEANKVNNIHHKVEDLNILAETIDKLQSILGFKKIIAFSGGGKGIQIDLNNELLAMQISEYGQLVKETIVKDIILRLRDYDVAILTGGTKWDIPNIATKIARAHNIPTIGIFPRRGEKYSMGKELLNLEIVVDSQYGESHFGDESSMFAKLADGVFVIGGGAGTLIEFAHVMKINESLKKYNGTIKKIVPIVGVPGVSETLHYIPGDNEIKNITFPNKTIHNGKEAFDRLRQELGLDDILKETY